MFEERWLVERTYWKIEAGWKNTNLSIQENFMKSLSIFRKTSAELFQSDLTSSVDKEKWGDDDSQS